MQNTHYPPTGQPWRQGGPAPGDYAPHRAAMDPADVILHEGSAVWGRTPPVHNVPNQTSLYKQGSPADTAFLIARGRFGLNRENAIRRSSIGVVEQGAWLGVPELLNNRPYASSAVALEPALVVPVNRELFQRLMIQAPGLTLRALHGVSRQALGLLEALEAQVLDQTFMGLCKGLELVLKDPKVHNAQLPESQLLARLRDLFALPTPSLLEAIKVLESLNILKRMAQPAREAVVGMADPATFQERVKAFSDQWKGRLPGLVAQEPPRDPYQLEELCELLGVKPPQFVRRMTMPDFPMGLLRFDPEGVELFRKTQGDSFFKKKVSGKELMNKLESVDELIEVEAELLRDILPRLELPKLIRLLGSVDGKLQEHLMSVLSARVRRTVSEELQHVGKVGSLELADLEAELLALCRGN